MAAYAQQRRARPAGVRGGVRDLPLQFKYSLMALALAVWQVTPLPRLITDVVVAMMPIENDVEIGAAFVRESQLDRRVVDTRRLPSVHRAMQHITSTLLSALPERERRQYEWRVEIVRDPAVNAFALPGGFIYLNSGLIESARSAGEVAGVLAHEMGHVLARHSQKRMLEEKLLTHLLKALVHEDGDDQDESFAQRVAETLARGAIQLGRLRYSRANEFEADALGFELLANARVGAGGMIGFFNHLLELERAGGRAHDTPAALASVQSWLSTHPATDERIDALRTSIAELPARDRREQELGGRALRDHVGDWDAVQRELASMRSAYSY